MMRLQQLALDRFGHFTDRVLDFGARPRKRIGLSYRLWPQ
mgnify:CR=1 FL=1